MEPISYSLSDIGVLIKRHSHDVRNVLNGMELELTLLDEAGSHPDARAAIGKLRDANSELGRLVQRLAATFSDEPPGPLPALQVAERWQADARFVLPDTALEWKLELAEESIWAEASLLRSVLQEMLALAPRLAGRGALRIHCHHTMDKVLFEITSATGSASPGAIETQQQFWAALARLAERSQITMEPLVLTTETTFPLRISLPFAKTET